ncbi:WD40 repeat domain-containing protein [Hyalangium versicolor]|uniref:WD40 repeat domain-containing protein n=1 Tax=Hyalangium versicolor TaxID=2861190 RepID=UPI001CC9B3EA|nr:hypothetical protein [Hyalangium versicolor]
MTIRAEDFQFVVDYVAGDGLTGWVTTAVRALVAAREVHGFVVPYHGPGMFGDVAKAERVGVSIVGTKRGAMLMSFAAFDADGDAVAWSVDIVPGTLRKMSPEQYVLYPDEAAAKAGYHSPTATQRGFTPIDAQLKKQLIRTTKPTAKPAPMSHEGDIIALAASPDATTLVSTGHDGAICIWDATTGERRHRITSAGGRGMQFLNAIAMSPDSKSVVGGARGLKRFDLATGKVLAEYAGHPKGEVVAVTFAPSGKYLASASASVVKGGDNTVALWDAKSGKRLGLFAHGSPTGAEVHFTTDEKRVFVLVEREDQLGTDQIELAVPSLKKLGRELYAWHGPWRLRQILDEANADTRGLDKAIGNEKALRYTLAALKKKKLDTTEVQTHLDDFIAAEKRAKKTDAAIKLAPDYLSPDRKQEVFGNTVHDAKTHKKLRTLAADGHVSESIFYGSPKALRVFGVVDKRTLAVWDAKTGKRLLPR